jgi:hypothetical protein
MHILILYMGPKKAMSRLDRKRKRDFSPSATRIVTNSVLPTDASSKVSFWDKDDSPIRVIDHLHRYFRGAYQASPPFFFGSLKQAVNAVLRPDSDEDVRLTRSCS